MKSKKIWVLILLSAFLFNILLPLPGIAGQQVIGLGEEFKVIKIDQDGFFAVGSLGSSRELNDVKGFLKKQKGIKTNTDHDVSYKIKKVKNDELKMTHFKIQQVYRGIPVYGYEIIAHADSSGQIKSINGRTLELSDLNITPKINKTEAVKKACDSLELDDQMDENSESIIKKKTTKKAELVIYNFNTESYLAYLVEIFAIGKKTGNWKVFIDGQTGNLINIISREGQINRATGNGYGYFGERRSLKFIKGYDGIYRLIEKTNTNESWDDNIIYTIDYDILMNTYNDPFYPDSNTTYDSPTQKNGVDALYYTDLVYNYFKSNYGWVSWDGSGLPIVLFSNVKDNGYNVNAGWLGWDDYGYGYIMLGAGGYNDGKQYAPFSAALDIVAHEYTHGISDALGVLDYQGQSGALNESMADAFACIIDPNWQIAEKIVTPGIPGDAIRDLSDPHKYGQPSHYSEYEYATPPFDRSNDYGLVHTNSGIPNKAFYNIASRIGLNAAGKIYFRALSYYFTLSTNFAEAKYAVMAAAGDIYGYDSNIYKAVRQGWSDVGVVGDFPVGIEFDRNVQELTIGNNFNIQTFLRKDDNSTVDISNNVTLISSNPSVVRTGANGELTPLAKGTAQIKAYYGNYSCTATVNVTPAVSHIQVDKTSMSLVIGKPPALIIATAVFNDGSTLNVTKNALWNSSQDDVASVASGVVYARKKGNTIITVSYKDKSVEVPVKVIPVLNTIILKPSNLNLTIGDVVYISGSASYNDGSVEDVTDYLTWKTSNSSVVSVGADGSISAVGKGKATITALFGGKSAIVKAEVTPPVDYLEAAKTQLTAIIGGSKVKINLISHYIDGTRANVTKVAYWDSENEEIATISAGTVTGISKGETNINARYKDKEISIPALITPKILSLKFDKSLLDLIIGEDPTTIHARAYYNDNSDEDVTDKAVWRSNNPDVIIVDRGLVTPVSKGTAILSAEFNGKKVNIKVTVTPPVDHLTIDKTNLTMLLGSSGKFKATAYYVDGSNAIVTNNPSLSWSSSDENVATVSKGVIKTIGKGEAAITAQYKGSSVTSTVKVIPAITSLYAPATLQLVACDPGTTVDLIASYIDGTYEDTTEYATWTSSNSNIAAVENGTITPLSQGTAYITAKYSSKNVTIKVTVAPYSPPLWGVIFDKYVVGDGNFAVKMWTSGELIEVLFDEPILEISPGAIYTYRLSGDGDITNFILKVPLEQNITVNKLELVENMILINDGQFFGNANGIKYFDKSTGTMKITSTITRGDIIAVYDFLDTDGLATGSDGQVDIIIKTDVN